jgi:hypothetical protein
MKLSRRRFLQVGVLGAGVLAAASFLNRGTPVPSTGSLDLRALDAKSASLIAALAPVILAGALPDDVTSRKIAINEVVEAFDRALSGLSPAVQAELQQLLGLLTFAPSRALVAGVWKPWHEASTDDVAVFLTSWRHSRFDLLQSGYQALKQLMQACWYGNPLAWGKIGFSLPPVAIDLGARP